MGEKKKIKKCISTLQVHSSVGGAQAFPKSVQGLIVNFVLFI